MPKKILSIDDSPMVHLVVAKALKLHDVEVLTASNGREGVSKARTDRPDLILLDTAMPVMDGRAALVALKAEPATKDIPVIMLGTDSDADNLAQVRKLGALNLITKPFSGETLLAGLRSHIDLGPKAA